MFAFIDHRKIRIMVYFFVMNYIHIHFTDLIFDVNENLFSGNQGQNV